MNMPLVLLNRRRRGFTAFSPSTLFSTTAIGIWLDPSDLTTMFSDRAGTTPVTTPGTVVGLRLDKSKGLVLGSELVVNGDFASGTTGWLNNTASLSVVSSKLRVSNSSNFGDAYQAVTTVIGKTYLATATSQYVSGILNESYLIKSDNSGAATNTILSSITEGAKKIIFVATATTTYILLQGQSANAVFDWSAVSVRELAGNHAVAPTDAARPIYGVEPKGGRRNLLTWTEDFRNTAAAGETRPWVLFNTTIEHNVAVAPNGTMTADRIITNTTSAQHSWYRTFAAAAGTNTATISVKANGYNTVQLYMFNGSANVGQATARLDLGTVAIAGSGSPAGSISSEGNGWYRITLTATSATSVELGLYVGNNGSVTAYAGDNTSGVFCWGAQLELGSTATNYQRTTTAYDVTESGVATCHYVQYDGSDDSMSTAAIDFTGTDKMSVFAGVRKLSDGTRGALVELSPNTGTNAGSFVFDAPGTNPAAEPYRFISSGTVFATATTSGPYVAPITNVLTGLGDISGDLATLRVNGIQVAQTTGDQGTGNFGNYPLFIGRRNNATLPFNGKDYGILVVGKAVTPTEITDTETWLAARTSGVTL